MKQNQHIVFLVILTGLIFLRVATQQFVSWDDDIQVYSNPYLSPPSSENLSQIWFHPIEALYIPVTYTVWMLIALFAHIPGHRPDVMINVPNYDPRIFHIVNLILHLINVSLVYFICLKLSKKRLPSLFGAAIFALHPLQVEPVAWISELRGLLSGMFLFSAINVHLLAQQKRSENYGRWKGYEAWGVFLGLLAILSKPSAVVLPLILLIIDVGFRKTEWKQAAPNLAAYTVFPLMIAFAMKFIQPVISSVVSPVWLRPFIILDSLYFYASKLVWPAGFAIDYGRTPQFVRSHISAVLLESIVPIAILVIGMLSRRRFPYLLLGILIVWATILPVSGIVPFAFQAYSTVADRYMYIGFLGIAVMMSYALPEKFTPPTKIASGLLIAVLSIMTFLRVPIWDNTTTLMEASIATNPNSSVQHNNLGTEIGQTGNLDGALHEFELAAQCDPREVNPAYNIANVYREKGDLASACEQFRKTMLLDPKNIRGAIGLGDTLVKMQQWDQAIAAYSNAIQNKPTDPIPYYNIANIQLHLKQYASAEQGFRKAVSLDDRDPYSHFHLAQVLLINHKVDEARSEYQKAIDRGYPDQQGLAQLGHALGQ